MKLWKVYCFFLLKPQSSCPDFTDEKNNIPLANHSAIWRSLAPAPQHEIPKHEFDCVSFHLTSLGNRNVRIITWSFLRSSSISTFCRFSKAASVKIYENIYPLLDLVTPSNLRGMFKKISSAVPITKYQ